MAKLSHVDEQGRVNAPPTPPWRTHPMPDTDRPTVSGAVQGGLTICLLLVFLSAWMAPSLGAATGSEPTVTNGGSA